MNITYIVSSAALKIYDLNVISKLIKEYLFADSVCGLQMNAGVTCAVSQAAQSKYYFDVTTGTCRTFQYSGCGGNDNRFDTQQQCESFCLASKAADSVQTFFLSSDSLLLLELTYFCHDLFSSKHCRIYLEQCSFGKPYRVGTSASNSACTTSASTCPSQYTCQAPVFGPTNQICCPTPGK